MSETVDIAALRAQIEAEMRAKVEQEYQERARTLVTIGSIAEERQSTPVTVQKVLDGGRVKPAIQHGQVKYYDPTEVRAAFIIKDRNILKYHGLLHMVEKPAVTSPEVVETEA